MKSSTSILELIDESKKVKVKFCLPNIAVLYLCKHVPGALEVLELFGKAFGCESWRARKHPTKQRHCKRNRRVSSIMFSF